MPLPSEPTHPPTQTVIAARWANPSIPFSACMWHSPFPPTLQQALPTQSRLAHTRQRAGTVGTLPQVPQLPSACCTTRSWYTCAKGARAGRRGTHRTEGGATLR